MTTGRITAVFSILLFCSALVFASGCSNSDMARVTINLGNLPQAKAYAPSLFDRIVQFITFSTKANADPTPIDINIDTITISVTTGGSEVASATIVYNVDDAWSTGQVSFDIPAGGPVSFTVLGLNTQQTVTRYYGGLASLSTIAAGADITVPISIGLLPRVNTPFTFALTEYQLQFYVGMESTVPVTGFHIYKRLATYSEALSGWIPGEMTKIATLAAPSPGETYYYNDPDMAIKTWCEVLYFYDGDKASYYEIIPFNEHGEGDTIEAYATVSNC
jgi:hypothetical protein